jgi:hypothetical protein
MNGPGKYDELATHVRESAAAEGVVLVVFGGKRGHGMSVQATADLQRNLPAILRDLADRIAREQGEPVRA